MKKSRFLILILLLSFYNTYSEGYSGFQIIQSSKRRRCYPTIPVEKFGTQLPFSGLLASSFDDLYSLQPRKNDYNVKIESPSFNSRRISANVIIDANIDDVWSILTDYNNLAKHVPNLVKSYVVPGPPNSLRLFQEGAQKIIGFDFRASVTMDMTEDPVDTNRALKERQLSFKLADSYMFSSFDGSWNVRYHSRSPKMDAVTKEITYSYKTVLTYTVSVKPKGPVPVIALEWRIKEDIPTNLNGLKIAAEKVAVARRSVKADRSDRIDGGGSGGASGRIWGTEETLGLYMAKRRLKNDVQ